VIVCVVMKSKPSANWACVVIMRVHSPLRRLLVFCRTVERPFSEMTSQLPSAPLLDGNGDDNSPSRLMTASITSIVDLFSSKCYIVKPTDRLRKHDGASKIPASDLLLHYDKNDLSHFVKVKVTDELKSTSLNELESNIRELLTDLSKQVKGRTLIPAIAKCESETWINLSMLRRSIQNEAELHFALADPILRLICSFWNLTVKLEETVKHTRKEADVEPLTPPAEAVTPDSRCDYIVYTVRKESSDEVVAVLIETKTTQHPKFKHAVAQVTSLVPLPAVLSKIAITCPKKPLSLLLD
jgi:hypothetical protein